MTDIPINPCRACGCPVVGLENNNEMLERQRWHRKCSCCGNSGPRAKRPADATTAWNEENPIVEDDEAVAAAIERLNGPEGARFERLKARILAIPLALPDGVWDFVAGQAALAAVDEFKGEAR